MPTLFRRSVNWRWLPDADPVNAPDGTLLIADNTVPTNVGSRSVRMGSLSLYSGLANQRVQSVHAPTLQSTEWFLAGIDDQVYRNVGSSLESFGISFGGSGDIAFGDDAYQAFMARGNTKKKFDGSSVYEWGLSRPEYAPILDGINAVFSNIASFNSTGEESVPKAGAGNAFVVNEGTSAFVANYAGTANAAMELRPDPATGRASASKKFNSDQDYLDIVGSVGSDTDLFDIRSWMEEPRDVDKLTVMFGLNSGADPFIDDYYYFDFNIKSEGEVDIKDPDTSALQAYSASADKLLETLSPQEITDIRTPEAAGRIVKKLTALVGGRSRARPDSLQNSPAWGHFTVTRGQFKRIGTTKGRDWTTIRGFKVVYSVRKGSTKVIRLDDAIWSGGGSRSLNGKYRVGYRYARKFKDSNENEIYTELSPMSPLSDEISLSQQTLQVTIPAGAIIGKPAQADQIWIYVKGGWLDTFYRFAITSAFIRQGMTIDELTNPSGGDFASSDERMRLAAHGFTLAPGAGAGSNDLVVTMRKSELEALVENETFEPGASGPPDNIIDIAGPWLNRIFALTSEGWLYVSSNRRPSSFSLYHTRDLRRYGTPLWMAKTGNGIFVGCTKDILRVSGSGVEEANGVILDIFIQEMNVAHPPVDSMHSVDGNSIIYRAADGPMLFSAGGALQPLPTVGTSLLWRNKSRNGNQALNTSTGRFRLAVDNHMIYMLAPEGSSSDPTSLWRYEPDYQQWSRFVYPYTLLCLYKDQSGRMIAGTSSGRILELETGNADDTAPIGVTIITAMDDGGSPFSRKEPADLQIHANTAGEYGAVGFLVDGSQTSSLDIPFSTSSDNVYRTGVDLQEFLRLQLVVTGSFNMFSFQGIGVSYTLRPQQVMVLDTGEIVPPNGGDLAWITEVELDAESPVDLQMQVWKNGRLFDTADIPVLENVRDVYRIVCKRGTKGRRLSLRFVTTNPAGEGNIGFEPWGVRVRHKGSGNFTELSIGGGDGGNV